MDFSVGAASRAGSCLLLTGCDLQVDFQRL